MEIKLLGMRLENFMCYIDTEFSFFQLTKILAENGRGKSSIVTAFDWVLFNCDYELKDNPQVRRVVDGKSVDDMDVSVTLMLDVDGKEVTLRKVQKRIYGETVKDGVVVTTVNDPNSYYINEVSKTLKAFNEYLDVNIATLKMCSNINVFLNQKPKEMREYLFSLVDKTSDLDMAKSKNELAELVPLLEKYTCEEIRAMKNKIKKDVDDNAKKLKGQIEEKERDVQLKQAIDVSDLELMKNELKEQIEDCIAKQTDNDKLMAEYDKASSDILNLKFELGDMSCKANEDNIKARREIEDKISDKRFLIEQTEKTISETEHCIELSKKIIESITDYLNVERKKWTEENNRQFDENSLICPYCGSEYGEDKKEQLRADFKKHKADMLKSITDNGNLYADRLSEEKKTLADLEAELPEHEESLGMLNTAIEVLTEQLTELPQEIDITDSEEYKALANEIAEKEQAIHKANDILAVKAELKAQESELRQQLSECERKIAESNTEKDEQRLEELRAEQRTQEQNKANAEKILDLLDELDKAKNETLSDSINSHFSLVKWKLFELNKSGGYKSVCIPTVDGKSILTTMSNKGNRILGRVDICNSIQKISGMSVPIILDDSESLDSINQKKVAEMVDSQLIMLIVNDSEKLEIVEG